MFIHPLMLAGLGGAVIPLLLHLLNRARYQNVQWGAMMFLDPEISPQLRVAKWGQRLLVGIRMLIVATLAIALARPIVSGNTTAGETDHVTAVILLDCSGSMSFIENGRSRFELAQRAAEQILATMRPGDRVALVPMGSNNESADDQPTAALRSVAFRIDHLESSYRSADLRLALNQAAEILSHSDSSNRDIYIVCDRQASSWQSLTADFAVRWLNRVSASTSASSASSSLHARVRTMVIPVGNSDSDNIALEAIRVVNPPVIRGQPFAVEVRLHNYSTSPRTDFPLTLRVGDRTLLQTSVTLPANQPSWFRFDASAGKPLVLNAGGSQVISAGAAKTGYTADDRVSTSIDVLEPINVLLISGNRSAGQTHGEPDYVQCALAPHQSAGLSAELDPCRVTLLPADSWNANEIGRYQVVILENIAQFTPRQVQALEQFVYDGGRVIVAPGNLSNIDNYNAELFRQGAGILPAQLADPTPADRHLATKLFHFDPANPIFTFLSGQQRLAESGTIDRYFPSTLRESYAWTLASLATGDAFMIEGSNERGRVILFTTPLDSQWNNLPTTELYLPLLQNTVRYIAWDPVHRDLLPGEPITLNLYGQKPPSRVTLIDPRGRRFPLDLLTLRQEPVLRYGNSNRVGTYRLELEYPNRTSRNVNYVVNPSLDESDLRQLTPARWDWLQDHLKVRRIETSQESLRDAVAVNGVGRDLWLPMLVGVLSLFALELIVSSRLAGGHGE